MVRISFVGDIMCTKKHTDSVLKTYGKYDYGDALAEMKTVFRKSDFLVGNLETPLAGEELRYTYKKWSFNSPREFGEMVKGSGFNLVSVANNHCLDRGVDGLINTMDTLDSIGLPFIGSRKSPSHHNWRVEEIGGLRVGFLSYTYGTNASYNGNYLSKDQEYLVNLFQFQEPKSRRYQVFRRVIYKIRRELFFLRDPVRIRKMLKSVKECRSVGGADFVVMCLHAGGQRNDMPESFTRWISAKLTSRGVNAVVGCHEHVVHPVNYGGEKLEAYSLGNFLHFPRSEFAPRELVKRLRGDYAIILHLEISKHQELSIDKVSFTVTKNIVNSKGVAQVIPVRKLYEQLTKSQQSELEEDVRYIVSKVTGEKQNGKTKILEEYEIKKHNGK